MANMIPQAKSSRMLVYETLEFNNKTGRVPVDIWALKWASIHYGSELGRIYRDFPPDIETIGGGIPASKVAKGDPCAPGTYIDDWGCIFDNRQAGVIGEVKQPLVALEDEDWSDTSRICFPHEWLEVDAGAVNARCAATDKFTLAGANPRPFEQLQFIRTTEGLLCDLMEMPSGLREFIDKMHTFYCDQLELWAKTNVDALSFMDDWGSQNALLINPKLWREIFKPLYKDYIDIAHSNGKKIFMHSDGYTLDIYPDLIELGLDAFNSQIFCMGIDKLARFAGKITFWGEIDRQHLLPFGTPDEIADAVRGVKQALWRDGGCLAQCEFGAGSKPENVRAVYEAWRDISRL